MKVNTICLVGNVYRQLNNLHFRGNIMKKLVLASVLSMSVSLSAFAGVTLDKPTYYLGDEKFVPFCKAVVNNDLELFRMTLTSFVGELGSSRQHVLNRVLKDNSVQCAGKGLIEFTTARNATEIVNYLNKQA